MKTVLSIVVAAFLLSSCSSQVEIRPTVQAPPDLRVAHTVGLHLSEALRARTHAADPYRNRHTAHFPVGKASAEMFERLMPDLFDRVVPLKSHPPDPSLKETVDAVIEPSIMGFRFTSLRVGQFRYWARVAYRINVFTPNGELITAWRIVGWGESAGVDADAWGKVASAALTDAGQRFARSLTDYPEAKRWTPRPDTPSPVLRPSLAEARAAAEGDFTTRAGVPDSFTLTAEGRTDVKGAGEGEGAINAGHLLAVGLRIENTGSRPLLLERSAVSLLAVGGRHWTTIPASLMAAGATQRHGRVFIHGPGPVGAVFGLVTALASSAAAASETVSYYGRLTSLEPKAFEDARLAPDESREGLVYFSISPADRALQRMELLASVIDVVSGTRHRVRLPVILPPYAPPKKEPENVDPTPD